MRTILAMGALVLSAGLLHADVREQHTTQKTFQMGSGSRKLIVDNISGSIHVTGYAGNTVEVTVNERWRADNSSAMADAHRDVRIDMTQEGDSVRLYVDGPFRCHNGNGGCNHQDWRNEYSFDFDFQVRVPQDAVLDIKNVNGGPVRVENSTASFNVRNVNGGVEVKSMAGSGSVSTVNGSVKVSFTAVPREACTFKTVNGSVEVAVPAAFSADGQFHTVNGSLYTDFDVVHLASASAEASREGTKYVYRKNGTTRLRFAGGGPEHHFETINGDITVSKNGNF